MPAFVIFELGQPARRAVLQGTTIRVGRGAANEIALPGEAISREHAVFARGPDGRWSVSCVSQTNPIVVDGAIVSRSAPVEEGTEVLVGSEHLIVFSDNEVLAKMYSGPSLLTRSQCQKCQWTGLLSTLKRKAACPRCASADLVQLDVYQFQLDEEAVNAQQSTVEMNQGAAKRFWRQIKEAKKSQLERLDGREAGAARRALSETEEMVLGGSGPSSMKLGGLAFGTVSIKWDGTGYVARSALKFPSMKVNGTVKAGARLTSGDLLEVGSNKFRFTTE
jgi:hypothetical protein